MEKYNSFADPSSGFHPFLPPSPDYTYNTNFIFKISCLWQFPLACLRFLTALIVLPIYLLLYFLFFKKASITRCLNCFVAYTLLKIFGCIRINFRVLNTLRSLKHSDNALQNNSKLYGNTFKKHFAPGDFILSNFTSLLEVLFLEWQLHPYFTILHDDGTLSITTFWKFIRYSLQFKIADGPGQYSSVFELSRDVNISKNRCVIIFPEAMKSNGLCQLLWKTTAFLPKAGDPSLSTFSSQIHLVGFSYLAKNSYLGHTAHDAWRYISHLLLSSGWTMNVSLASRQIIQELVDDQHVEQHVKLERLRHTMSQMLFNANLVNISGNKLQEFYQYWKSTQSSNY